MNIPAPWVLYYAGYHMPQGHSPSGWFVTIYNGETVKYIHSKGMKEVNATGFSTLEEAIANVVEMIP